MSVERLKAIHEAFELTDTEALLELFTGIGWALSLRERHARDEMVSRMVALHNQLELVEKRVKVGLSPDGKAA